MSVRSSRSVRNAPPPPHEQVSSASVPAPPPVNPFAAYDERYWQRSEIQPANFATKGDLAFYALKTELGNFAPKAELEKYILKGDTANFKNVRVNGPLTVDNNVDVRGKHRLVNAGHDINTNNFSAEIYAPPNTAKVLETSLRFHQGNKYWRQIRVDNNGFRFTEGDKATFVPISASNINASGDVKIADGKTLCIGNVCLNKADFEKIKKLP